MTKEDKELFLKDLCARVPYHPKGHVVNACNGAECDEWLTCATFPMFTSITNNSRLYLRSMSSMTEEECIELGNIKATIENISEVIPNVPYYIEVAYSKQIDWLNKHHFDYRGLIEKGLALEAPEGMYDVK